MSKEATFDKMICLVGGSFLMGSDAHYPEERPQREARVGGFQIDAFAVTNRQFAVFVADTGYKTTAELPLDPALLPGVSAADLAAGSLVFHMPQRPVALNDVRNWWRFVPDACWHAPEGAGSTIKGREDHPVVHVSLFDAQTYATWAGKSLPTEEEWEFAAQGGAPSEFPWGDSLSPDGTQKANTWVGQFPYQNKHHPSGTPLTVAVDQFAPNAFGLYNMIGNVWEWTCSPFQNRPTGTCCTPQTQFRNGDHFTVKGGSHLCAPSYCRRYRSAARSPQETRSSTSHIGFRCVTRG